MKTRRKINKCASILLITSILVQSTLPAYAMDRGPAPLTVAGQHGKTAAGILHYALHEGDIRILLGRRDDSRHEHGDWCNFGGGSEEAHDGAGVDDGDDERKDRPQQQPLSDLSTDAARESAEESNRIYAPHPRVLRHQPFIDVITEKAGAPFLHRMYWQQVQYVAPEIFRAKLEDASGHNKEYTDFMWVRAGDLFNAATTENPLLQVGDRKINIFAPLFATLSTVSGKGFLEHLSTRKSLRAHSNLYYHLGGAGTPEQFYQRPLYDADAVLAEAVAAHGMAMTEIKRRQLQARPLPARTPTAAEAAWWNPHCDESISRIHLRIVLGPDYKTPEQFAGEQNPRREAELANIRTYFNRYAAAEYEQKNQGDDEDKEHKAEFKRAIRLRDSDYELFADALAFEEANKAWPTFYHGANANLNNLFKSFTALRELIVLKPLDGLAALRGTDIYFRDGSMQEFLTRTGYHENDLTQASMLFLNFTLFAGRQTTVSTSSSVEYVINDHSVNEPDLAARFEEALALAGFSKPVYTYFQSLFEQHFKYRCAPLANSVLLAVSQNPQNIDAHSYPTGGGGHRYAVPTTSQVLHDIQAEYEHGKAKEKEASVGFAGDPDKRRALFPENRLFLHPDRVMDYTQTRIQFFDRFPLSQRERQVYDQEMRQTTVAMLAEWLAQKSTVMEGSFLEYPALKTLYNMAYKGVTGHELQETPSVDGFIHLVRNGHLEAVKRYIASYPQVLEHEAIQANVLMNTVLESDNPEFIDYCVQNIFRRNLNALLTQQEFLWQIRTCKQDDKLKSLLYLLQNYDFSEVSDAVKLQWLQYINWENNAETAVACLQVYRDKAPHLVDETLDNMLRSMYSDASFTKILISPFINSQKVLENICARVGEGVQYNNLLNIIAILLKKGVDLRIPHSLTEEPLAWAVSKIYGRGYIDVNALSAHPDPVALLEMRNQEGLTLLQAMQKAYLEENKPAGLLRPLQQLLQQSGRDYVAASYQPFIEHFGRLQYLSDYGNVRTIPENRVWIERLQAAQGFSEVQELMERCPDTRLLNLFRDKISPLCPPILDAVSLAIQAIEAKAVAAASVREEAVAQSQDALVQSLESMKRDGAYEALLQTLQGYDFAQAEDAVKLRWLEGIGWHNITLPLIEAYLRLYQAQASHLM
ncbi:MAG: hypothetical protein WCG04_04840, partial [Alphaproteobacteria bacterium]